MPTFAPNFLDDLKSRFSLVSMIGRHVRLVKKGRSYLGICPFHNEKSPSFSVVEDKNYYHCFGCGAHGDLISFVMHIQHVSFLEAIEQLANESGLVIPVSKPQDKEKAKHQASLYEVMEKACNFFQKQLSGPLGARALTYLRQRGLDDDVIARFRLGFSPDGGTLLNQELKNFNDNLIIESGLFLKREKDNSRYDRFRGRLMFPITDQRGRIIAFGGRSLTDDQPKYLNSPETLLFHKGDILYAYSLAREAAFKSGTIIVVEGYMDVISMHRSGFTHTVAPLGTALTEKQIESLWKISSEPVICLDGDSAGQRAALKAAERALTILQPGRSLRFATLPASEDPDSLLNKHGKKALSNLLSEAIPLSDLLWSNIFSTRPYQTPEQIQGIVLDIEKYFSVIPDQRLRTEYIYNFKQRLNQLTKKAYFRENSGKVVDKKRRVQFVPRDRLGKQIVVLPPQKIIPPAWLTQERLLLLLVIMHPSLIESVEEKLGELAFTDTRLDKIRLEVLKHAEKWRDLDFEKSKSHLYLNGFDKDLEILLECHPLAQSSYFRPETSIDIVKKAWDELYDFYRQREVTADLESALQRAGHHLTDATFNPFYELWWMRELSRKQ